MRLSKSWIIASKDLKIVREEEEHNLFNCRLPPHYFISSSDCGRVCWAQERRKWVFRPRNSWCFCQHLFSSSSYSQAYIPTPIASYSLVGEKVEKSLEPLLATPTTDSEILLGKGIAAFLPPIGAIFGGATIFMVLIDLVTYGRLGYYYFPNLNTGIVLFLMVPLAAIMSVEWNVIVSSRVSDVRAAQQLGALIDAPLRGHLRRR